MFCSKCGLQIADQATACASCATPITPATSAANHAVAVADKVKAASKDSLQAFLTFATNPVGGLSVAYENLGPAGALRVGICFGILFAFCATLGIYRLIPVFWRPSGGEGLLRVLVCAFVPFITLAGASALARMTFRGTGGFGYDSFAAGASLLPFGCVLLLAGILGAGNMEVISALATFALCLTILMLFAGCTRIAKMSERLATLAVPLMLMVSAWLSKVIYSAMMNSYAGSNDPFRFTP